MELTPEHAAARWDLIAARKRIDSLELALEIANADSEERCPELSTAGEIYKLRWWKYRSRWGRDAANVKYYGHGKRRFVFERAEKLRATGYVVEIEAATVHKFEAVES
jgi:hypothetical protein